MSWKISENIDLEDIIFFLKIDEWKNIQALSEFCVIKGYKYPNKSNVLTIINRDKGIINGLILITSKGLVYPIFSSILLNDVEGKNQLIRILATINFKTHGVIGLQENVDYFDSILYKRIRGINNYLLLHREIKSLFNIDKTIIIKKANVKDINKLIPLEFEYQKEEVLLDPKDLNKIATYENLKKKLKKDDIYYIIDKNIPITKGGTTFKSDNFTLIGGVFTWKEKRNCGYSTKLLEVLLNEQLKKGYKGALFVKDDNVPALHLYKKLGFIEPTPYKINYYYR